MSLPDNYYYLDTRAAETGFTDTPQAAIDINRILANKKDCFILPEDNSKQKLKKTIIINTWCKAHNRSDALQDHILELLAEGFEIYQVQNGELKRIERIQQLDSQAKAEINEEKLKKLLASHKMEQIKTQVLDYGQCQQLFGKDSSHVHLSDLREADLSEEEQNQILASDLCLFISDWKKDKHYINKAKFIASVGISALDMPNDATILGKIKHFGVTFEANKGLEEFFQHAENCESVDLDYKNFEKWINPPDSLKKVTIRCKSSYSFQTLIDRCKKCTEIIADGFRFSSVVQYTSQPNLKKLTLTGKTYFTNSNLFSLLENAPNLEFLSIEPKTRSDNEGEKLFFEIFLYLKNIKSLKIQIPFDPYFEELSALPNLENLDLSHSTITAKQLISLLNNCPNLQSLNLENTTIVGELSQIKLPKLKSLYLRGSTLTPEQVTHLVNASTNLTELSLKTMDLTKTHPLPQTKLQTLDLFGSKLSNHQVDAFMAPSLIQLKLGWNNFSDNIKLSKHLTKLRQIQILDKTTMLGETLYDLLANSPALEDLSLEKIHISTNAYNPHWDLELTLNLSSLELNSELLQKWSSNPEMLNKIISYSAANLDSLTIDCKSLTMNQITPALDLKYPKLSKFHGRISEDIADRKKLFGSMLAQLQTPCDFSLYLAEVNHSETITISRKKNQALQVSAEYLTDTDYLTMLFNANPHPAELTLESAKLGYLPDFLPPFDALNIWNCKLTIDGFTQLLAKSNKASNNNLLHQVKLYDDSSLSAYALNISYRPVLGGQQLSLRKVRDTANLEPIIRHMPPFNHLSLLETNIDKCIEIIELCIKHGNGQLEKIEIKMPPSQISKAHLAKLYSYNINLSFALQTEEAAQLFADNPELHEEVKDIEEIEEVLELDDAPTTPFNLSDFTRPQQHEISHDETLWSQAMLINRLSAFSRMKLSAQQAKIFEDKIIKGICSAESKWFADTFENEGYEQWLAKLKTIKNWNTRKLPEKGSQTERVLSELVDYVAKYQLNINKRLEKSTVTNQLETFLQTKPEKPVYIENTWHRICVLFKDNQWYLFDPNYKNGQAKRFAPDQVQALIDEIHKIQGHGIEIISFHKKPDAKWINDSRRVNQFIAEGGFNLLTEKSEDYAKLEVIDEKKLDNDALEGLFLTNLQTEPCWYAAMNAKPKKIRACLNQCLQKWGREVFTSKINASLDLLDNHQQQWLINQLQGQNDELSQLIKAHLTTAITIPDVENEPKLELESLNELTKVNPAEKSKPESPPQPVINQKPDNAAASPENSNSNLIYDVASLEKALQGPLPKEEDLKGFVTWKTAVAQSNNVTDFNRKVGEHTGKNVLISYDSEEQLQRYIHHLQSNEAVKSHGLYIINSPDDLRCASATLSMDNEGRGIISAGPSGPLYNFLKEHENKDPRIVVNWHNFEAQKLVQSNSLIDTGDRRADGTNVAKEAIVISLQVPNAPGAYRDSDFSSRHDVKIHWPAGIELPEIQLPEEADDANSTTVTVDFFDETHWQGFLLGNWSLSENALQYYFSPLLEALQKQPPPESLKLCLKNAPMHLPEFRYAINSLISERALTHLGKHYTLPGKLTITSEKGYDLLPLVQDTDLRLTQRFSDNADFMLNPDSISHFFQNYHYEKNALSSIPGWLKQNTGKTLNLYLTREIPLSSWARLLTEAKLHQCKLSVSVAPGIELPEEITALIQVKKSDEQPVRSPAATLQISNDLYATELRLSKEHKYDLIIDASELSKGDLFYAVTGKNQNNKLHFDQAEGALWQALCAGKNVLLKGQLKPDIADALAPLFQTNAGIYHNGKLEQHIGKLTVLTNNEKSFAYIPIKQNHEETLASRLDLLAPDQAQRLQNAFPDQLTDIPYAGLKILAEEPVLPAKAADLTRPLHELLNFAHIASDFDLSEEASSNFKKQRQEQVLNALARHPTLFIAGETGTGKSSFMHELNQSSNIVVHFGDIKGWASAKADGKQHLLFMDEANLDASEFSGFSTLYSNPAGISIKGEFFPISKEDNKQVVFGGNPANANYQGRKTQALFSEHPNVVAFGPMSNAYLYHEVLKPILTGIEDSEREKIARLFLMTFQHIKAIDGEAISARELQMMAYLLQSKNVLPEDNYARAKWYAYQMGLQTLKKEQHTAFSRWFENEFNRLPKVSIKVPKTIGHNHEFLLVPSHFPAYVQLIEMMRVRQFKQSSTGKASYGGLTGQVLEGEPGIGKSALVKQTLLSQGLTEKKLNKKNLAPFNYEALKANGVKEKDTQRFYYLPANLSTAEKINAIHYAFHTGAVVIIDELNSSTMIERLVNAVLMGEDLLGRRALKPGFTLIGTQNPSSMDGRYIASLAIQRRVLTCDFPEHTIKEKVDVLMHQGCELKEAANLVFDYEQCDEFARKNNRHPKPCFRDLQKRGQETNHSHVVTYSQDEVNYTGSTGQSSLATTLLNAFNASELDPYQMHDLAKHLLNKDGSTLDFWLDNHPALHHKLMKADKEGIPLKPIIFQYLKQKQALQHHKQFQPSDLGQLPAQGLPESLMLTIALTGKKRRTGLDPFVCQTQQEIVDKINEVNNGQRVQLAILINDKLCFFDVEKNNDGQLSIFGFDPHGQSSLLSMLPPAKLRIYQGNATSSFTTHDTLKVMSEFAKYPHAQDYCNKNGSQQCKLEDLPLLVTLLERDNQIENLNKRNKENGLGQDLQGISELITKTQQKNHNFARQRIENAVKRRQDLMTKASNIKLESLSAELRGLNVKEIGLIRPLMIDSIDLQISKNASKPLDVSVLTSLQKLYPFERDKDKKLTLQSLDCYEGKPFLQLQLLEAEFNHIVGKPVKESRQLSDDQLAEISLLKGIYLRVLARLPYDPQNVEFNKSLKLITKRGTQTTKLIDYNVSKSWITQRSTTRSRTLVDKLKQGQSRPLPETLDVEKITRFLNTAKKPINDRALFDKMKSNPVESLKLLQETFLYIKNDQTNYGNVNSSFLKRAYSATKLKHIALLKKVYVGLVMHCFDNQDKHFDKEKLTEMIKQKKDNLLDFNTTQYHLFHKDVTWSRGVIDALKWNGNDNIASDEQLDV